jgi:hypothetical protein
MSIVAPAFSVAADDSEGGQADKFKELARTDEESSPVLPALDEQEFSLPSVSRSFIPSRPA